MEMVTVYRLNNDPGDGGVTIEHLTALAETLVAELQSYDGIEEEDGPQFYIFVERMDRKTLDNLPEWDGF
jgi:hypothetical protein